ncbi:hypothetical protein [Flavobacterium sp. N2270]|uniref:hypothetical protein n=1 Tax=Flavobacterium sp. N2270 TaxID=2986831 RepID=UPI0022240595|nr:hypothetical protein [Flavobacterium sp. N2270]
MKSLLIIFLKGIGAISVLFLVYNFILFGDFTEINIVKSIIVPACVITCLLLLFHYVLALRSGVKKNFSVHQQAMLQQEFELSEVKKKLSKETKWRIINETENTLVFKSGMSTIKSFGEIVKVTKIQSRLHIESKPSFFATLVDYGRNFQNVKKVTTILSN